MNKQYHDKLPDVIDDEFLEGFYEKFVLPEFGVAGDITWTEHVQTDPDNFLHLFSMKGVRYALAFDDYPSGFSVRRSSSTKALRLPGGEKVLHVSATGRYTENITGSFKLFQINDTTEFKDLVGYLTAMYARWRNDVRGAKGVVVVGRDLLEMAETAAYNHDLTMLGSLKRVVGAFLELSTHDSALDLELLDRYIELLMDAEYDYEFHSLEEREAVAGQIYASLSEEVQRLISVRKYEVNHLGNMIKLVHAMYVKTEGEMTSGMSIAITCEDGVISYPNEHFANDELKKYFAEHMITGITVEHHLPEVLSGYRLISGSVHVQYVFKRELDYVGF